MALSTFSSRGFARIFFSHRTTKLVYTRTRLLCSARTLSHFFCLVQKPSYRHLNGPANRRRIICDWSTCAMLGTFRPLDVPSQGVYGLGRHLYEWATSGIS